MCLIYAADGEAVACLAMHSATGFLILVIEGTAMLINHDAVLLERTEAIAIKLLGEKSGSMTERINRIADNQIIFIKLGAQKAQAVSIENSHAAVIKAAGIIREKVTADIDKSMVSLHHVNLLDFLVMRQLTRYAAVAAADNQHLAHMRMHGHRYMHDHLVINKLVLL